MCVALIPQSSCGSCAHMVDEKAAQMVRCDKRCSAGVAPDKVEGVHETQQKWLSPMTAPAEGNFPCVACSYLAEDKLDGAVEELDEEDCEDILDPNSQKC